MDDLVMGRAISQRKTRRSYSEALLAARPRKTIPHEFVLDAIEPVSPVTRPMFGCLAVYVGDKIVLILRDRRANPADNGVWLATTEDHHASLKREFPSMRSIRVLGKKTTGWQLLPADGDGFEEAALRAAELVVAGDPRIGKVPGSRRKNSKKRVSLRSPAPRSFNPRRRG
jgi:hypothetical protein